MLLKLVHFESDVDFDTLVRCEAAAYDTSPCKPKEGFLSPHDQRKLAVQSYKEHQLA